MSHHEFTLANTFWKLDSKEEKKMKLFLKHWISTSGISGKMRTYLKLFLTWNLPQCSEVHLKLHITKIKHQSSSTIPNPQNWAQRNKLYLQMNSSLNLLHFSYTNTTRLKTVDILIKTLTLFLFIYILYLSKAPLNKAGISLSFQW